MQNLYQIDLLGSSFFLNTHLQLITAFPSCLGCDQSTNAHKPCKMKFWNLLLAESNHSLCLGPHSALCIVFGSLGSDRRLVLNTSSI